MFNDYKKSDYRIDVYKKYADMFYRFTEEYKVVRVSFSNNVVYNYKVFCRVCVWGEDGFDMVKDYEIKDIEDAFDMFLKVISLNYLTQEKLREFGFVSA